MNINQNFEYFILLMGNCQFDLTPYPHIYKAGSIIKIIKIMISSHLFKNKHDYSITFIRANKSWVKIKITEEQLTCFFI